MCNSQQTGRQVSQADKFKGIQAIILPTIIKMANISTSVKREYANNEY